MRTLGFLTIAATVVGLLTTAACSSAPEGDSIADKPVSKKSTKPAPEETPAETPPAATPPAATPPPVLPPPDAITKDGIKNGDETDIDCGGTKAVGCADGKSCLAAKDCVNNLCNNGTCKAPQVATQYCQNLGPCCSSLSGLKQVACLAAQFAGKEVACQGQLLVCGFEAGSPCNDLTKCCNQMQSEGYPQDANDCRAKNTGNAQQCTSALQNYRGMNWCS